MERKSYSGGKRDPRYSGRPNPARRAGASSSRNARPDSAGRPSRNTAQSSTRTGRANEGRKVYNHNTGINRSNNAPRNRRKPPVRRFRFDYRRINPAVAIVIVAILAVGIYVGSAWITVVSNKSTYCDNITINGINMTSYGKEAGEQAVQAQIDSLTQASYTLTWNGNSWTFNAADFDVSMDATELLERAWNIGHNGGLMDCRNAIASLKSFPVSWETELTYNDELIDSFVDSIYDSVYLEPVDAEVTITEERPYLTGVSSTGLELDRDATREQIVSLLTTGTGSTELKVDVVQPAISSDEAAGGIDLIVDFTTDISFRGWSSRYNVRKALTAFNGLCVYPGQTVSFNDVVGPRTKALGWQKATEYAGGKTTEGYGGGVCQASSTLYNAVLMAGMDIITRYPHSMTVTYLEPSLDAAVTNTNKNMVFTNNTDHAIYIYTSVGKTTANVKIYGNRPEYRYELRSVVISEAEACSKVDYVYDTEGKYVYYTTDEPVLYKAGHPALVSDSYLDKYDWVTGDLVESVQLTHDSYRSGTDIYWKGIHKADGTTIKVN